MAETEHDFDVVRASLEHLEIAAPLFDEYRQFYSQPSDPEGAQDFLSERMAREESVVFLALDGSRGLGFKQLYPLFSSVSMRRLWILNDLFVEPGERGRGVGAALLEEAARLAVETQAKGLVLATATDNVPAQRLYEKMGWERDTAFYHYSLSV